MSETKPNRFESGVFSKTFLNDPACGETDEHAPSLGDENSAAALDFGQHPVQICVSRLLSRQARAVQASLVLMS